MAEGAGAVASAAALGLFQASAEASGAPGTTPTGPSLYDRLGGYFGIALVVNRFSDEIIKNPILRRTPHSRRGTRRRRNRGCRVLSSVARCGSRQRPADPLCTQVCR